MFEDDKDFAHDDSLIKNKTLIRIFFKTSSKLLNIKQF